MVHGGTTQVLDFSITTSGSDKNGGTTQHIDLSITIFGSYIFLSDHQNGCCKSS